MHRNAVLVSSPAGSGCSPLTANPSNSKRHAAAPSRVRRACTRDATQARTPTRMRAPVLAPAPTLTPARMFVPTRTPAPAATDAGSAAAAAPIAPTVAADAAGRAVA
eukprot:1697839-Pleurochrysis_carterae.AAC.1